MSIPNPTIVNVATIYTEAKAWVATIDPNISVVFGRRELAKQMNQGATRGNRIAFIPGDDTGKDGQYTGPRGMTMPRRIYDRLEIFQVRCWGQDPSDANDEVKQYIAERHVQDVALNALKRSASGGYMLSDAKRTITPVERVFGAEVFFLVTLRVPVLHLPIGGVPAPPQEPSTVVTDMTFASGDVQIDPPT